jgi:hypothetical protein
MLLRPRLTDEALWVASLRLFVVRASSDPLLIDFIILLGSLISIEVGLLAAVDNSSTDVVLPLACHACLVRSTVPVAGIS